MKFRKLILTGLLASVVTTSTVFAAPVKQEEKPKYSNEYQVIELVADYASQLFIDEEMMPEELIKQGFSKMMEENPDELIPFLKTMISTLDPYSEYFTLEEYVGYVNDINRAFYGIGVVIQKQGDYIQITSFTKDSPSEQKGMQVGDKIAKVDGADMSGKSLNEVRAAIMGELGTEVLITVLRNGEYYDYKVSRALVNETTVEYAKIDDNIAYISISDMAQKTTEEFKDALAQIDEWGIKKIILDLRNNGGGYLNCAVDIARLLVPKGLIVKTEYRDGIGNGSYYSELKEAKYDINVLVNQYTASSAEILASAIQDSGVGKLIGKKTYGKAVIQKVYQLVNKSVLKLTVGRYTTRNGKEINEVGLIPDENITNVTNLINTKDYTQFDFKTKPSIGMTGQNVKAAKERLYLLGVYSGELDENFDEGLHNAVSSFQKATGLHPYGVLDITTQVKIENTFAKLEVLDDLQFKKAVELFGGEPEQ